MTKIVTLDVSEPVSAANVRIALADVACMAKLGHATTRGTHVDLYFTEDLDPAEIADLKAREPFLPLVARKLRAIKVASEECEAAIVGGIQSDVTGTAHYYDSDRDAQLNLVGAAVSQQPTYWHVRESPTAHKVAVLHTPAQIVAVGQAVAAHKAARIAHYQQYRVAIQAATSIDAVETLRMSWDAHGEPQA